MRLHATTSLMNAGLLDVTFTVPLDAQSFTMAFRGSLGPMSVAPIDSFVEATNPVRLSNGSIVRISFDARATNGVAHGTITPLYNDLSITVLRSGSTGILGGHGIFGGAARGIASFLANRTRVRGNNPDGPGKPPRVGQIQHVYKGEGLPGFLWASVWEGMLPVALK